MSVFLYFILVALIIVPLVSFLYAYLSWYNPIVYLGIFLTVIFGLVIGFLANIIIKKGKVRNTKLGLILGFSLAFVAFYFQWVFWVDLVYNYNPDSFSETLNVSSRMDELLVLFKNPGYFFDLIKEIYTTGVWEMTGSTIKGIFLGLLWLIEFLVIMVFTYFFVADTASKPFEESSETWYKETILSAKSYIEDTENMVAYLETGKDDVFDNWRNAEDPAKEDHCIMFLYSSKNEGNYLTINNNKAKLNNKNEIVFDLEEVVNNIYISNKIAEDLLKM